MAKGMLAGAGCPGLAPDVRPEGAPLFCNGQPEIRAGAGCPGLDRLDVRASGRMSGACSFFCCEALAAAVAPRGRMSGLGAGCSGPVDLR